MKNKKLLLTALLSVFALGSALAQFNFATSTNIGQVSKTVKATDNDTLTVNFNTSIVNSIWSYPGATPTVLTVAYKKCQTQKGLQALAYPDATTATAYGFGSSDCNSYTAQRNPIHVASIDSLKKIMNKSVLAASLGAGGAGGSANDSLSRPAACLFDITPTNQAFGMYPGKCKRIEYAFFLNLASKAAASDITFDIDTYDAGTTGKTASYELAVYASPSGTPTIVDANLLAPKVSGFYVTGSGKQTVNVAAALGLSPTALSNKRIIIFLRTLGTSNASNVVDGIRNEVDANKVPIATDPTIVLDNFQIIYGTANWVYPTGAVVSTIFNHNNGSPVNLGVGSVDYSGGTPTAVVSGVDTPVYFYITDANRIGTLDITEGNNGGTHSANFAFAATGAVKRRAANGTFTTDVPYTYTASNGTSKMDLLIAAPASGSINDTLQVAVLATGMTTGLNATDRLEITNGVRFWYNVGVLGVDPTAATDHFRSKASGNWSNATTWESSADNSNWITSSLVPNASAADVTVTTGKTVALTANAAASVLTIQSGSTLSANAGTQLSVATTLTNNGTLNLLSDASATATILTPSSLSGSGTYNVSQYLTSGRNWYLSSPVSAATSAVVNAASNILYYYDEPSATWPQITNNTTGLSVMKGYVASLSTNGAVTFSGTINNGAQSVDVSRTPGQTKEGFNLIGNPYPSYLDWDQITKSNIMTTMWYRTKTAVDAYTFDTYNSTGQVVTSNGVKLVTNQIPPMQAFWVRIANGQTSGSISTTNTSRSHADNGSNSFKSKSSATSTQPVLRLEVSNGTNSDQAVVYYNAAASNTFDDYDSPKLFNNSASIPEIYTLAGTEQVVINGLNDMTQMTLGFTTGEANNFTIKASQFVNFVSGTQIILHDNMLNNDQDLTVSDYNFYSDVTINNESRFTLMVKAPSVATGINGNSNGHAWISLNGNNQIVVNGLTNAETTVTVCNEIGQKMISRQVTSTNKVLNTQFTSGVYMVTLTEAGKNSTTKVIIK